MERYIGSRVVLRSPFPSFIARTRASNSASTPTSIIVSNNTVKTYNRHAKESGTICVMVDRHVRLDHGEERTDAQKLGFSSFSFPAVSACSEPIPPPSNVVDSISDGPVRELWKEGFMVGG